MYRSRSSWLQAAKGASSLPICMNSAAKSVGFTMRQPASVRMASLREHSSSDLSTGLLPSIPSCSAFSYVSASAFSTVFSDALNSSVTFLYEMTKKSARLKKHESFASKAVTRVNLLHYCFLSHSQFCFQLLPAVNIGRSPERTV